MIGAGEADKELALKFAERGSANRNAQLNWKESWAGDSKFRPPGKSLSRPTASTTARAIGSLLLESFPLSCLDASLVLFVSGLGFGGTECLSAAMA